MTCIAPSIVLPPNLAGKAGVFAERKIAEEFLTHLGRRSFFPASTRDFSDISVGFGNSLLYAAYLKGNHPTLSAAQLINLSDNALMKIPDLATFDVGRSEFYEIKPDSLSGISDGNTKVANVHALYQHEALPYIPGRLWNPDTKIHLLTFKPIGFTVDVEFHYFKRQPGLILYDFCATGRMRKLTATEVAFIIAAVLIKLMTGPLVPVPVIA